MLGSAISVFSEPEDFEAALREDGCLRSVVAGPGQFWARLNLITLQHLRVFAVEERLARIAFIAIPADMLLISFPKGTSNTLICGGIEIGAGAISSIGAAAHAHARTEGPCHWGAIRVPLEQLARYGGAMTGGPFVVPPAVQRWRPQPTAGRDLQRLHAAAARAAAIRPQAFVDAEAAHGLEQQLLHAIVECLGGASLDEEGPTTRRHREIIVSFEHLLQRQPARNMGISEICAELGISDHLLRNLCAEHLGMSPTTYGRLRRMSLVRRALRRDQGVAGVAVVARRYGFSEPGRFAMRYRAVFGEAPSTTLRRGIRRKKNTNITDL